MADDLLTVQFSQDFHGLPRQRGQVVRAIGLAGLSALHSMAWDSPDRVLQIDLLPRGETKFSRLYEGQGDELKGAADGKRALVSVDCTHEGSDSLRFSDGRHVRSRERTQCAFEICRCIVFSAPGGDSKAKHLANHLQLAVSGFDRAARFDPAHDLQKLGRLQRIDRRGPDPRKDIALKMAHRSRVLSFADLGFVRGVDPRPGIDSNELVPACAALCFTA